MSPFSRQTLILICWLNAHSGYAEETTSQSFPDNASIPVPLAPIVVQPPTAPEPIPVEPIAGPVASDLLQKEIAALQAEYAELRRREADTTMLMQPASNNTLREIDTVSSDLRALVDNQRLTAWVAEAMAFFRDAMAAAPLSLPADTPLGLRADPAVAILKSDTPLYSSPTRKASTFLNTVTDRTTVLRVAEAGATALVWTQNTGFAFVATQYIEVYE